MISRRRGQDAGLGRRARAKGRSGGEGAGPFGILGTGPGTAVGSRLMPATCAFCAIIRGETPAVTILETERLLAFLDHRPLFYRHTLLEAKQTVRMLRQEPAAVC